jgi:hypothetical protein
MHVTAAAFSQAAGWAICALALLLLFLHSGLILQVYMPCTPATLSITRLVCCQMKLLWMAFRANWCGFTAAVCCCCVPVWYAGVVALAFKGM